MTGEPWYHNTSTVIVHKFRDAHDDTCYEVSDSNNNIIGKFYDHGDLIIFLDGKIKKMGAWL
jgi:hypothetical protein